MISEPVIIVEPGIFRLYTFLPTTSTTSVGLVDGNGTVEAVAHVVQSDGRVCAVLNITERGEYHLVGYNASTAVFCARVICENQMTPVGPPNPHRELVSYFPTRLLKGDGTSTQSHTFSTTMAYLMSRKQPIPYTTVCWGIDLLARNNGVTADSISGIGTLRFFTAEPEPVSGDSYRITSVSDTFTGATLAGFFSAAYTWQRIEFSKPLQVKAGDRWGIEVTPSANNTGIRFLLPIDDLKADMTAKRVTSTIAAVGSTSSFQTSGTANMVPGLKPVLEPPTIAIAGHSFWAGSDAIGPSNPPYSRNSAGTINYVIERDIADLIYRQTGIRTVNISEGGTRLFDIASDGEGWVDTMAAETLPQTLPALVIYDTSYSDTNYESALGVSSNAEKVWEGLDRLLAQCTENGARLALLESPLADVNQADQSNHLATIGVYRDWAVANGIEWIPAGRSLNRNAAGVSNGDPDIYAEAIDGISAMGSTDDVHPSATGAKHIAKRIAQWIGQRGWALPYDQRQDDLQAITANQDGIGPGSVSVTLTVTDTATGDPVPGVDCWITTTGSPSDVVAGTQVSDALGQVTFNLDPGTYDWLTQISGYETKTTEITVT